MAAPKAQVPVTVLTGFLGSGKTTLLKNILTANHGLRIAVLINDFGSLNIDAALVQTQSNDVVELANGCVCCTLRDDLLSSVLAATGRPDQPDHLIIEASGISDPLGIAETLHQPALVDHIYVDGIIAVVDAEHYPRLDFHNGELALSQMVIADFVLLNKIDLSDSQAIAALERDVRVVVPKARILHTEYCEVPLDVIIGRGSHWQAEKTSTHGYTQTHEHIHAPENHRELLPHSFSSVSWETSLPVCYSAFKRFVDHLPTEVIRAKGVLCLDIAPEQRSIFQLVGKRSSIEVGDAVAKPHQSRVVLIGRDLDAESNALLAGLADCTVGSAGTCY